MMTSEDDRDRDRERAIAELTAHAKVLVDGVNRLTDETGDAVVGLARRGRNNRRLIWALGLSLLLDVVLTLILGLTVHSVDKNAERIDHLSGTVKTQVCAMFQIFENANTPAAREAARVRGDDLAQRDSAYMIIHNGYVSLDCSAVVQP